VTAGQSKSNARLLWALAAVLVLLALGATAMNTMRNWGENAAARKLKNPVPATPDAIAAGKADYGEHCRNCHGEKGDGKGEKAPELSVAPGDFTDARKLNERTDGELYWQITRGRLPMPAFDDKLSDQQRWQLVDYIRTFAAKSTSASRSPNSRERALTLLSKELPTLR
jgi:mono/diheme cytochrome c family protein